MKVQLFYPRSTIGFGVHNGVYFSLTLLNLASYVRHKLPDADIQIFDGNLYDEEGLIRRLDPKAEIVGISCESLNYANALKLARKAKDNGSKVVLGGLHASYYGEIILRNRPNVDYVVYGKGEEPFFKLLTENPQKAPNLIWRDDGSIRINPPISPVDLDDLEPLEHSLLELEKYSANHRKVYPEFPDRPLSVASHEGCVKREAFGPCSFCSLQSRLRFRNPVKFWLAIQNAVSKYEFNLVKDWGDSLTGDKDYLRRIVETRPSDLEGLVFSVYNSLGEIDQETIELLKKLNVRQLFAAVESGNNGILKNMNKRVTKEQMKQSIELIGRNNIPLYTSYVLGERGETVETLEETLSFARYIKEVADVRISNGSPIAILPGSPNFERLAKIYPFLKKQDLLDLKEVRKKWIKYFCPELPDYKVLEQYAEEIGKLGILSNRYGWDPEEK